MVSVLFDDFGCCSLCFAYDELQKIAFSRLWIHVEIALDGAQKLVDVMRCEKVLAGRMKVMQVVSK